MTDLISLAQILDKAGVVFVLALFGIGVTVLYLQERKKTEKLHGSNLSNARDSIIALNTINLTLSGLKDLLLALRPYATTPQYLSREPQVVASPTQGGDK